jgi:acyl-[acyl-carrier-protein] desaturase
LTQDVAVEPSGRAEPSSSAICALHHELEADRPRGPMSSLLSPHARARAIERGIAGLYRRYTQHSQQRRNWHADTCTDWRLVRSDHAEAVHTIVEGFFGVEQYTPDYVTQLVSITRKSYGRSQWQVRWGAEEERHADLWRNAVLAFRRRDEQWVDDYTDALRMKEWRLPWESPLHMVFYQVIQERATQVSYVNLGLAVTGELARLPTSPDAALARACRLIATDEAAHYHFFVEVSRLLLYYDPANALDAFVDVLRMFTMPARDIMPGYDTFGQVLHDAGVFSKRIHYSDVVQIVLDSLSLPALRALEAGVRRAREVPTIESDRRTTAFLDTLDHASLETKVRLLFKRTQAHLERAGLSHLVNYDWQPAWLAEELPR